MRQIAFGLVVALVALITLPASAARDGTTHANPIEAALDLERVVQEAIVHARDSMVQIESGGCGVIVSPDGHILTATHCIEPGRRCAVILEDGRRLRARALGGDSGMDCALIKAETNDPLPFATMGRSSTLVPGQPVISFGYPGGGFTPDRGLIVRFGRVVAAASQRELMGFRGLTSSYVHTTALMEPGDSGGPLFDLQGRVIGINSQIEIPLDSNFHVPVDAYIDNWDALLESGGFSAWEHAIERMGADLERGDDGELQIAGVDEDGTAIDAGLAVGDVVVAVNGEVVEDESDFNDEIRYAVCNVPGEPIQLEVERNDRPVMVSLLTSDEFEARGEEPRDQRHIDGQNRAINTLFARRQRDAKDAVVRVRSKDGDERFSTLGCVIDDHGHVVSKASLVASDINVIAGDADGIEATVIARDNELDLVLLHAEGLEAEPVELRPDVEHTWGNFVASPRPGTRSAVVGIVASHQFRSTQPLVIGVWLDRSAPDVLIERAPEDMPAGRAGVKAGDRIIGINDTEIADQGDLREFMATLHAPRLLYVHIRRGDSELSLRMTPIPREEEGGMRHAADRVPGGVSERGVGFPNVFCHDARLLPHDVGGPLIDTQGRCIGINISRVSRTHSLAVPAADVIAFVEDSLGAELAMPVGVSD